MVFQLFIHMHSFVTNCGYIVTSGKFVVLILNPKDHCIQE